MPDEQENEEQHGPQAMMGLDADDILGIVMFAHAVLEDDTAWAAAATAAIRPDAEHTLEMIREAILADVHVIGAQIMAMQAMNRLITAETAEIEVPDYPDELAG